MLEPLKKKYRINRHKIKNTFLLKIADYIYEIIFPFKGTTKKRYNKVFKKQLNLKNPITFNEKIQWLKLYDRSILHTICADKLAVRNYIKKEIGEQYLIPLYFSTKKVSEIKPNILPDCPVVIKPNHNSGTYFIINNKDQQDWKNIRKKLEESLNINYYYYWREWQYKNIEPQVIVEKLLTQKDGTVPYDYKFHCINGKVSFIQVDMDRQTKHTRNLYDTSWNLLDVKYTYDKTDIKTPPKNLKKMIELAEKLATPYCYVRIDFYESNNDIYFGEITFHPEAGFGRFTPDNWDLKFGQQINLHKAKIPKHLTK